MGTVRITKEERTAQLIECATKVFAEKGYSNATTKQISEEAQVSEKLIYLHFKNKKELFLACLKKIAYELNEGFTQVIVKNKDNPLDILKQFGLFFFDFVQNNQFAAGLLGLRISDVKNDPDILKAYRDILGLYVDIVEKTIKIGAEKGMLLANLDPRALAWIYVGTYNTFLVMKEFESQEFSMGIAMQMGEIMNAVCRQ